MKIYKLVNMVRGWFIGDFEPSVLKTKDFEVGLLTHKKDEKWPIHYHKETVEYNVLIEGAMRVQNTNIQPGEIFVFDKGEIADPIFLDDCRILCIKVPSIPTDKYEM